MDFSRRTQFWDSDVISEDFHELSINQKVAARLCSKNQPASIEPSTFLKYSQLGDILPVQLRWRYTGKGTELGSLWRLFPLFTEKIVSETVVVCILICSHPTLDMNSKREFTSFLIRPFLTAWVLGSWNLKIPRTQKLRTRVVLEKWPCFSRTTQVLSFWVLEKFTYFPPHRVILRNPRSWTRAVRNGLMELDVSRTWTVTISG